MSELKPCPFCGGEAKFETHDGAACAVVCQTCRCGTSTVCFDDGMQAVAAWNSRDERTCELRWLDDGFGFSPNVKCSSCGVWLDAHIDDVCICSQFRYCPMCGAKIKGR